MVDEESIISAFIYFEQLLMKTKLVYPCVFHMKMLVNICLMSCNSSWHPMVSFIKVWSHTPQQNKVVKHKYRHSIKTFPQPSFSPIFGAMLSLTKCHHWSLMISYSIVSFSSFPSIQSSYTFLVPHVLHITSHLVEINFLFGHSNMFVRYYRYKKGIIVSLPIFMVFVYVDVNFFDYVSYHTTIHSNNSQMHFVRHPHNITYGL